uniref:Ovule protein n=1 Tax=Brugia timori TaxID=42155 RepID=A0A0R3QXB3_9BILA
MYSSGYWGYIYLHIYISYNAILLIHSEYGVQQSDTFLISSVSLFLRTDFFLIFLQCGR